MRVLSGKDKRGQLVGTARVVRGTDAARLMQRIFSAVEDTLDDLEAEAVDPARKAAALGTLSRTVRDLAEIEERRSGRVDGKSIKDLTTEQLKKLAANILKQEEEGDPE